MYKMPLLSFRHLNLKTVSCPLCGKLFSRKDKMKEHFNRIHVEVKANPEHDKKTATVAAAATEEGKSGEKKTSKPPVSASSGVKVSCCSVFDALATINVFFFILGLLIFFSSDVGQLFLRPLRVQVSQVSVRIQKTRDAGESFGSKASRDRTGKCT